MRLSVRLTFAVLGITLGLPAQQGADRAISTVPAAQTPPEPEEKRLFGIIPNFRTSPSLANYKPLTVGEKFKLATADAFDRGTFILAAASAGESQLTNADPTFGHGVKGYAHYYVASFADWSIGDYMTEGVFPSLLHQDPRYFRKGTGSGFSRLAYAMSQIFWTHTDAGGHTFNFSEIGGNATAVAISQAYYPENRTPGSAAGKLALQVGVDMASNIVKEFYPEIRRKLRRKTSSSGSRSR